ncbi:MAG: DUF417 family protein [Bacteroidetes bacterium]|nr:DUF417 family protein [Bacteroidota bacterium]
MRDLGVNISRIGVGIVLFAIGLYKFTAVEADAIFADVSNSPILSWLYKVGDGSHQFVSNLIGAMEILIALLIFFGFKNQKAALLGGILGTITFLITLSFFFTSPSENVFTMVDWCPTPNGFILKDIVFLGVCLQLAIENW